MRVDAPGAMALLDVKQTGGVDRATGELSLSTGSVMYARFGVNINLAAGVSTFTSSSTGGHIVPVGGWIPAIAVSKVRMAWLINSSTGNAEARLVFRKASTTKEAPTAAEAYVAVTVAGGCPDGSRRGMPVDSSKTCPVLSAWHGSIGVGIMVPSDVEQPDSHGHASDIERLGAFFLPAFGMALWVSVGESVAFTILPAFAALAAVSDRRSGVPYLGRICGLFQQATAVFLPTILVPLIVLTWRSAHTIASVQDAIGSALEAVALGVLFCSPPSAVAWAAGAAGMRIATPALAFAISVVAWMNFWLLFISSYSALFAPLLVAFVVWCVGVALSPWRTPRLGVPTLVVMLAVAFVQSCVSPEPQSRSFL